MNYPELSLYINGEFLGTEGRKTQAVINPANGETLGQLPHATAKDLQYALDSSQKAFESWRYTSPMERSAILRKVAQLTRERAEDIAYAMTLDQGKPLPESRGEIVSCADHADWHAEECRRTYGRIVPARKPEIRQMVVREPVGVCVAFTPWNFPYNQAIRKICAAIGAGCTIILKGPEDTPSAIVAIAQMFHDAGLPAGVLNIVWGVPAEVSETLITSPIVRKVSFTGSVPVGKHLAALAGAHMKRVTMELGGHSPVIVFNDADIKTAANHLAKFKMRNAGQVCISPSRFYIQEGVFDEFSKVFVDTIQKMKIGDGLKPDIDMGPLAHQRRIPVMDDFIHDAQQNGGQILFGGESISGPGFFYQPTVISGQSDHAKLMTEEPFGPIAPLTKFKDPEEAYKRANSLPYGLSSFVFTTNLQTAQRASQAIEAGMVNINYTGPALPENPFGGVKDSGIGSEGGTETFDGYLVTKLITQI